MGASKSKVSKSAVSSVGRKYPSRPSPAVQSVSERAARAPVKARSEASESSLQASLSKTEAIDVDARDPAFASRLHKLGIVQPNPFLPLSAQQQETSSGNALKSHTMPENPALLVYRARQQLQKTFDGEQDSLGRKEFPGKTLLDVGTIREALRLRRTGLQESEIEKRLGLRSGVVQKMGAMAVVDIVT